MHEPHVFVVVGAGLAGAKAAETLRETGFGGEIVLLGEELERPCERPPLSKGLLLGTADRESVFVQDAGWYAAHDVDLRTGVRATARPPRPPQPLAQSGGTMRHPDIVVSTDGSEQSRSAVRWAAAEARLRGAR